MKKVLLGLAVLGFLFLSAFKSNNTKTSHLSAKFCLQIPEEEHIELMDGKIITGDVTKCKLFKRSTFKTRGVGEVVIDGVKYDFEQVMAVKYKKDYLRKLPDGKDFANLKESGKINLYYTLIQTGANESKIEYIQKGDKGPLVSLYNDIRDMVKDNPKCVEMLDSYDKQSMRKQNTIQYFTFHECVRVYNGN